MVLIWSRKAGKTAVAARLNASGVHSPTSNDVLAMWEQMRQELLRPLGNEETDERDENDEN